ncbi:MAG: alpha/beta hydrolase family protein [Saprospiraceae bacterium]
MLIPGVYRMVLHKALLTILLVSGMCTLLPAADIHRLEVFSSSMQMKLACLVFTPDGYTADSSNYNTIYLLHGYTGNENSWLKDAPHLPTLVDQYRVLVVCPDAENSWYLDCPAKPEWKFETYMTQELVPAIDSLFRTNPNKNGRAIAGLSMGGHGALFLAARHPDLFGAAGSMAGGLDLTAFPTGWNLQDILGNAQEHSDTWTQHSVWYHADAFAANNQALYLDCGTDDFFLEANRRTHQVLLEKNVPHFYQERPGEHNGAYWGDAVRYQFLFFSLFFAGEGE